MSPGEPANRQSTGAGAKEERQGEEGHSIYYHYLYMEGFYKKMNC